MVQVISDAFGDIPAGLEFPGFQTAFLGLRLEGEVGLPVASQTSCTGCSLRTLPGGVS